MSVGHECLTPGDLHVWMARDGQIVDQDLLRCYARWISPQETERMDRFVFARHRHQYLIARALVRSTLSRYAPSVAPGDWRFRVNAWGKPSIRLPPLPLAFNLSHTDGLVVLAVTPGCDVGIDVEHADRPIDLELAERFFSPSEARHLRSLPEPKQPLRFFDLWTLKEAYIKACGKGLSIALDSFSFDFPDTGRIDFARDHDRAEETGRWQFSQYDVSGYTLALCCRQPFAGGPREIRMFETVPGRSTRSVDMRCRRSSEP